MTTQKPQQKTKRTLPIPLIIVALVLMLIGIGMLVAHKVQRADPTLTAAPPSGIPGVHLMKSPENLAKERALTAKANAQLAAIKAGMH